MKRTTKNTLLCLPLAGLLALGACSKQPDPANPPGTEAVSAPTPPAEPTKSSSEAKGVKVSLAPTQNNTANGALTLTAVDGGVKISGTLAGLKPGAEHAFHVHEKGDCSAPDASSAGPHLNPDKMDHGKMGEGAHHAGDMPNITADSEGAATVDVTVPGLELGTGGPKDVIGKAIVLHADPDDYKSQPAGNAGGRIACGVVAAG